jgi:hypothetical protein
MHEKYNYAKMGWPDAQARLMDSTASETHLTASETQISVLGAASLGFGAL